MEGYLRNAGYSILGLGKDLLFSDQSLLEAVRKKYFNWLEKAIRIIYNSSGFLSAFYCPLNFINASVVSESFLHHEERKVDKGACISFRGQRYETKPELIG